MSGRLTAPGVNSAGRYCDKLKAAGACRSRPGRAGEMQSRTASRNRTLLWLCLTALLGLVSRKVPLGFYAWDKVLGDALYAAAVYLVLALLVPGARQSRVAVATLSLCAAIELFQLTDIPMQLARTPLRWLLGTTFAWEDLAYYALGTMGIYVLDVRVGSRPGPTEEA